MADFAGSAMPLAIERKRSRGVYTTELNTNQTALTLTNSSNIANLVGMKQTIALSAIALCLFACNKKDDKETADTKTATKSAPSKEAPKAEAPKAKAMEMVSIDVVHEDFKATMSVPKGTVFAESYGTLELKLDDGKDFFIQIETDAPDMAGVKDYVEKNDVQKLKKFHTDSADTYIYETEAMGRTSFWLDTAVKFGESTVHCKSGRGANSYTMAHINTFKKSCDSLSPKE